MIIPKGTEYRQKDKIRELKNLVLSPHLDAFKVGVFDGHDSVIGKELLGVVVNQLPGK